MNDEKEYPIGTQFVPYGGKRPEETVIDVLKTYNSKGELVKVRYLCTHNFCGQKVTSTYPRTSLDRVLLGKQASCAREEAPPVPDYENARKLMAWEEGGGV